MLKQKTTVVNLANRLCTRLEENADYQNGAEVVILGEPKRGAYPEESPLKPMAGELAQFGPLSFDPTFNAHGWYVLVWDELGVQLSGILLGDSVDNIAAELGGYGADKVLVCESPLLAVYNTDAYAKVICDVIEELKPEAFLIGATNIGRDLGPRCAARLHTRSVR